MHPEARDMAERFLRACDAAAPGLVTDLYIVGSTALDDFQPGKSDLDFLAVVGRPITVSEGDAIARALGRRFDGMFITPGDLQIGPGMMLGPRWVITSKGFNQTFLSGPRDPIAWVTLAQCGVVVRGAAVSEVRLWNDPARVFDWILENAYSYWRALWRRSRVLPSPAGVIALSAWFTTWSVLGLARQVYTARTGMIASKAGAGRYALEALDLRWRPIIEDALRIRAGEASAYANPFERRTQALAFMDMAMNEITKEALRRYT